MLYNLFYLRDSFSPLNIFQYITFRTGGAFITALFLCLFFGGSFIRKLQKIHMSQNIRDYAPSSHQAKSGTPTMGGVLILVSMSLTTFLWARLDNPMILMVLICGIYLGFLGALDDAHKWILKNPNSGKGVWFKFIKSILLRLPVDPDTVGGVSRVFKLSAQVLLAVGVASYFYIHPTNVAHANQLVIPYFKGVFLNLGAFYIPFIIIIIVGSSNAVNLTDGLDGLAAGTLIISALTFGVFSYVAGHARIAEYLRVISVPGSGELTIYLAAMAGACLGFLWFNSFPAEIFMGDAGALFMGGTIGIVAICIKQELILVVVGGIFVMEVISVLTQVVSFRFRRGKRVFRMAPFHHHFEMGGMHEVKVTVRFWIIAIILSLVALSSLKLR